MVARLTLTEMGLDYKAHHVELYDGENITPWFARINPLMTVPSMIYNGKILNDSRKIVNHLCQQHLLSGLIPFEQPDKADVLDFVEEFYEKFDHLEGYTKIYSPWDHREQLRELGENPEFKELVERK